MTTESEPVVVTKEKYDLHIRLDKEMQPTLKDAAELAYRLGDTPKPDLVDLINLFIGWGLSIQKKKWLDRLNAFSHPYSKPFGATGRFSVHHPIVKLSSSHQLIVNLSPFAQSQCQPKPRTAPVPRRSTAGSQAFLATLSWGRRHRCTLLHPHWEAW